jgi:signal transduction histidine kinase
VDEVIQQLRETLRERNAQVQVDHPLPTVLGHPTTLLQVLANLVHNAVKFVADGVTPQVRVRAEEHGNWVRVWVEDNGIGIAPEHQERIFGVFERLHSADAYPGTGIGLAIVRKGVERMGGRVGVVSQVNKGSRFWFELRKA